MAEAIEYPNDDVRAQALVFVQNIVKTFGESSLAFVAPVFPTLVRELEGDSEARLFVVALRTVAAIVRAGDRSLLNSAVE
jgi:hypothetical protein